MLSRRIPVPSSRRGNSGLRAAWQSSKSTRLPDSPVLPGNGHRLQSRDSPAHWYEDEAQETPAQAKQISRSSENFESFLSFKQESRRGETSDVICYNL